MPSYLVADQGTGHRGDDHDKDQQRQRHTPAARQYPAQNHGGLAGYDESEEHRSLAEYERRDDKIGNRAAKTDQVTGD
jgi:hypothetical protein